MTAVPPGTAGEPEVLVLPDQGAVFDAASEHIADLLREAVAERGRADFATTGGSTPVGIYRRLATDPLRARVPWGAVHVWWGDDRFVRRDDPLCNVLPADTFLFAAGPHDGRSGDGSGGTGSESRPGRGIPIPMDNVHPFPCTETIAQGGTPDDCAARYAEELRASPMTLVEGWPAFDLILVGVGPDGHLMSVFPGSAAFDSPSWTLGVPAPSHVEPHVERVTLNPALLGVARHVMVAAYGTGKADVMGRVFGAPWDPRAIPAQLARRAGATWILDAAAAARLPSGVAAGDEG